MNIIIKGLYKVMVAMKPGQEGELDGDEYLYVVADSFDAAMELGSERVDGRDYEVVGAIIDGHVLMEGS